MKMQQWPDGLPRSLLNCLDAMAHLLPAPLTLHHQELGSWKMRRRKRNNTALTLRGWRQSSTPLSPTPTPPW